MEINEQVSESLDGILSNIDTYIKEIKTITEEYEHVDGSFQGYMYIHDLARQLNAKLVGLTYYYMELDKLYTKDKENYEVIMTKDTESYLDSGMFKAVNRAEAKVKYENIDLKSNLIVYERITNRVNFYIKIAGDTRQDMRSYISSLKKEKEYDQFTSN